MPMIISIEELDARWKDSNNLMALLPLLEYPYPEVLMEIENFDSISEGTLTKLIAYSLIFPSRHWALSAVMWIENGFNINMEICDRLLAISNDKSDTQKLRHKSIAQAKKWKRVKGI